MLLANICLTGKVLQREIRNVGKCKMIMSKGISSFNDKGKKNEAEQSERMKKFHDKLKLDPIPKVSPGMRFVDLMLVKTNPNTGELISDAEKDPTKWGDWQNGGRVSDF